MPRWPRRTTSFDATRLDPYERYTVLRRACDLIEKRRDELARTITAEAGFPVADAVNEVDARDPDLPDFGRRREAPRRAKWCRSRRRPATRIAWRSRSACRAASCAASRRSTRR